MRTRYSSLLAVVLAVLLAVPPPARADIFGGDVAVLSAILAEDIMQGLTMANQLTTTQAQLRAALDAAKSLNPRDFAQVQGLLYETQSGLQAIDTSVRSVNDQFDQLFRKRDLRNASFSDFQGMYGSWLQQINTTVDTARRLQDHVGTVRRSNTAAQRILDKSVAGGGEVQQLQSILQMLGVMQQQLGTLIQSMQGAGQVTNTMAANAVVEKQMAEERRRRRTANYRNRGKPVEKLTQLPTAR